MDIYSQLESLGLNGRQSRVYLALLQLGSASAMPVGVQFIAPALAEAKLLKTARAFEMLRGDFPAPANC